MTQCASPTRPTRISYRGQTLGSRELSRVQRIINRLGDGLSRAELAKAVCKSFGWKRPDGTLASSSCRLLLSRLQRRGLLRLPSSLRKSKVGNGASLSRSSRTEVAIAQPVRNDKPLVGSLLVRPILDCERAWWRAAMDRYHYLGSSHMVGESLCYVAFIGTEAVALLGWAAAALHNRPRDEYLGWDAATRARNLSMVVNNTRFLILPWAQTQYLASRVLAANLRRLLADWQSHFGHRILLAETFVDAQRFAGTCYRASNWTPLGLTMGFARQGAGYREHGRRKLVFIYPLHKRAEQLLNDSSSVFGSRTQESYSTMLKLNVSALPLDGKGGLIEVLRKLPDPRMPRGKRYGLAFVLTSVVCATLAGAKSISAIVQWVHDQSRATLRRMGNRRDTAPSYTVFWNLLTRIDASLVDEEVGDWIRQHQPILQGQGIAIDGKTLRGSAEKTSKGVHLVSAVLHEEGIVIAQTRVSDKTNEIKSVEPLLATSDIRGAVVTGDAMFTQKEIAKHIVQDKKADYLFTVKDNQPTLRQDIESLQMQAFSPSATPNP